MLDPFAGIGLALAAYRALERRGLGVEILPERADFIRGQLRQLDTVLLGDARALAGRGLPFVDVSITSPSKINRSEHVGDFAPLRRRFVR